MNDTVRLPLIPLRGLTVFPNMVIHFDVGRDKSVAAVNEALMRDQRMFLVAQTDVEIDEPKIEDIKNIGTICNIKQIIKLSENTMRVLVEGESRGELYEYLENDEFFEVMIKPIIEEDNKEDLEIEGYFKSLKKAFISFITEVGEATEEMKKSVRREKNVNDFVNMVSGFIPLDEDKKQELYDMSENLIYGIKDWKDKKIGLQYSRETAQRNIRDIMSKNEADRINKELFDPIQENTANQIRFINDYNKQIEELDLDKKAKYEWKDSDGEFDEISFTIAAKQV